MLETKKRNKTRLVVVFALTCMVCIGLAFRVGWVQVVDGQQYKKMAVDRQTRDEPITAKRGIIYDRNGEELAISAPSNTVWARTSDIKQDVPAKLSDAEQAAWEDAKIKAVATSLSAILQTDPNETYQTMSQKNGMIRIDKYVDKTVADQVRKAHLPGISITENVKRYYPNGPFASLVLGTTNDDNQGISGIELQYNQYLSGVPGRWIRSTDGHSSNLAYGVEKYYPPQDGLNVVLTIDKTIQHYVEQAIDDVQKSTGAKRTSCLVMNPQTGEVLAMASSPDFDPNNPRVPLDPQEAAEVDKMNDTQKVDYWNSMWRNPLINDTYEPGSTFKLITAAAALEDQVTYLGDHFYCDGYYDVADHTRANGDALRCWKYKSGGHGNETMEEGVGNSCNVVLIQLAQRVGKDRLYQYLKSFGFMDKTGIDYPGEAKCIVQDQKKIGPVELATMAYGQGIAVTPIELLTAICSFGDGGKLLQPHLVKELTDSQGHVVQSFQPQVVRQVVSEQTANEIKTIMQFVVEQGGGKEARIPGYTVGGKTGTANKPDKGGYSANKVICSYVGMAPMENPQLAVLVIVDEPPHAEGEASGNKFAGPGVRKILEQSLRYLEIPPSDPAAYKGIEKTQQIAVPNVIGYNYSAAQKLLTKLGLNCVVSPAPTDDQDFVIVDQYPKPEGAAISKGSTIYLYRK